MHQRRSTGGEPPPSLAEIGALQPWPPELRRLGEPVEWLFHIDVAASPERLWPHLSDTSRLNRSLGTARMELVEKDGTIVGTSRNGGFRHEWIEVPWTWVAGRTLTAVREYRRGFFHVARSIYMLAPLPDGGTRVSVYFGWIPRGWLGRLALRMTRAGIERDYRRALADLDRGLAGGEPAAPILSAAAPPLAEESRTRLAALRAPLLERGCAPAAVDRLFEHLERGDEIDLYRLQVPVLARRWELDQDALLVACLHATRVGVLRLTWDVICPHCRGVRAEVGSLGDVPARGSCTVCDIEFDTDAADAIEITFHAHPSIREVPVVAFCSAEPARKPHIAVQQRIAGGETRQVATALAPGRYRMRLHGQRWHRPLEIAGDGPATVEWAGERGGEPLRAGPAPDLALRNPGAEAATYVVEETVARPDALRPSRLFNLQEFRDLFSEEYLGADIHLAVGEQTILFTDIVGSTRLYGERGDPAAFVEVRRHFAEIYEEVRKERGAVVKTIGDAAMAAFNTPVDAVRAAWAIQRRFPPDRADLSLRVRVTLNTGPCIAVNLNSGIDYFGGAINLAAKLQALAGPGQIVFSETVLGAPGVAEFLADKQAAPETLTFTSKALLAPVQVRRWDVYGVADRAFRL